jgi:hypothetical protein
MELARASWRTLKADRELLVLPVLSFVCSAVVLGITLGLVFLVDWDADRGLDDFELSPVGYVLLVLGALAAAIIGTFFQAAMVSGAWQRLTGGDPTVGSAIAMAGSRLGTIIPWAIFSWTVGAILRAIQERAGIIGKIAGGFLEMAFRVLTFLAIPVVVLEKLGPFATVRRCTELFRQTWGENLIAQLGFGILGMLLVFPIIVLGGVIGALVSPILGVIVAVPLLAAAIVVLTSLTATFQTALYHYVATGQVAPGFEQVDLAHAFQPTR